MALTLITANFNRQSFVAKDETTSDVLWRGMAVVEVDVGGTAGVTDFPLAVDGPKDSATTEEIQTLDIQAAKIINPTRLKVSALIKDISIVENIISTFNDPTITLTVNTKSIIVEHLVMVDLEIQQSADMLSAAKVDMNFEQAQLIFGEEYLPEQAADGSVYGLSIQNPASVSMFASLAKTINSILGSEGIISVPDALLDDAGRAFKLDGPSKLS